MVITTKEGILTETELKSPKIARLLVYLLLSRKAACSPREIVDALWADEDVDSAVKNIKGLIYRLQQAFGHISNHRLITSTANGYQLNPKLHITTDYQLFDKKWNVAVKALDIEEKIKYLKKAVELYQGPMFRSAKHEHWIMATSVSFEMRYLGAVSELMKALFQINDYLGIQQYAAKAVQLCPHSVDVYFWMIVSMYKLNNPEMAKGELRMARCNLLSEEYIYGKKFTCADCGSVMKLVRSFSTKKDKVYFTFKCPTYAEHGTRACNAKKMRKADLDEAVLASIKAQFDLFIDCQHTLEQLLAMKKAQVKKSGQANEAKALKKKIEQKKALFSGLYRDLREGLLDEEDYSQTREVIMAEITRLEKQLVEVESVKNEYEEQLHGTRKWDALVKKYYEASEISAELVDAMIETMQMNEDNSLSIQFKHMDAFKAVLDTIETLRKEVA